jgi:steroid delta-isomerase-like uncharacterized protein
MSKEQNLQAANKWGEAINSGNLEVLRELVTPHVVEHDSAPNQGPGAQGYIDMFTEMRSAFPDLSVSPEHVTADEDSVALAYTMTGTQQGDFMGIKPTGRKITARGVQIARYENGLMVERWGSSDQLGILEQLGVKPKKHEGILEKLGVS